MEPVFSAMLGQTYRDTETVAVISGNDDHGKEFLMKKFPQVKIIDPGYNIGFAKGHNLVFSNSNSEFFQLVNPDLVMKPDYVEKMLEAFRDPKVGAATGKLLRCGFTNVGNGLEPLPTRVIDSTGVVINKSGSARDRGQHEVDNGQYDKLTDVQAVCAAGAMYRRTALEAVKIAKVQGAGFRAQELQATSYHLPADFEYFDEDFHSYWEDVDLAWRMTNAGYKCAYQPQAVAFHGRGAGSSEGGYKKVFSYIKYHSQLSPRVRELNYRNHIFMYVKNSRRFYPQFFFRELAMFAYICLFERSTLKVVPQIIRLLPKMWQKRKIIKRERTRS